MHRSVVGGRVQRVAEARVAGVEVLLLQARLPRRGEQPPPGGDDSAASGTADAPDTPRDSEDPTAPRAETVHLVVAAGAGVGTCGGEARARLREVIRASPSAGQVWRGRLLGARVVAIRPEALALLSEGRVWWVDAGASPALAFRVEDDPRPAEDEPAIPRAALDASGRAIVHRVLAATVEGRRDLLRRAVLRAVARLDRRAEAIEEDLSRAGQADLAAARAQLFVTAAAKAPRGATSLVTTDWSDGEGRAIEMPLDPARTAREQIDAVFQRARRLRRGASLAADRLTDARQKRRRLAAIADELRPGDDVPAARLAELEAQAREAAPDVFVLESLGTAAGRDPRGRGARTGDDAAGGRSGKRRAPAAPPYRTFSNDAGARIFVGKGAARNDALTFGVARPHDLWLHAKNRAGAHVVVPLDKGASCPAETLVDAAHLAAHFSDARDEQVVEVTYAARRYVRKPRGSPPGLVAVDREKVIVLRREEARLRRLLAREIHG